MLEYHKRENGLTPVIFEYQFKDKRSPEFYLIAIPNPDYETAEGKKKILSITAYALKSRIAEDIQKHLYGGKFTNTVTLEGFYRKIARYNVLRVMEFRYRLASV